MTYVYDDVTYVYDDVTYVGRLLHTDENSEDLCHLQRSVLVCVCVFVSIYMYMHVYLYVYMYVYVCLSMCMCMAIYVYVCLYLCVCMSIYMYTYNACYLHYFSNPLYPSISISLVSCADASISPSICM